jgi:nucleotidyltransferase substrate binding protein (TIGR01987 family)
MTTPFELKKTAFTKALSQLEKALKEPETEYMRDASIQRFEFTYELAWNMLKVFLATLDLVTLSPKETLKTAYQQGLLKDANAWTELHQKRNLTSYTYDAELAESIYKYLKNDGLALFKALQETMESRT